jgi:hypothetical protein
MSCLFCGNTSLIKAWTDLLSSTPDLRAIVEAGPVRNARGLETYAAFDDLRHAAKLGCSFCSVILEGILEFADGNGQDITEVALNQWLNHRDEDRLGEQDLLRVSFKSSPSKNIHLRFYTADSQFVPPRRLGATDPV